MINKRRAIPLIVVIFLVCIVLALGLYHVFTSFDIKRSEDIVGAINVTTTGSSENIPLATSNNGDFSGIFFQEAEYNKLIILKKNWMTGRYSCWGTASTLSTVGTYQSVDSHNRIVVVYPPARVSPSRNPPMPENRSIYRIVFPITLLL